LRTRPAGARPLAAILATGVNLALLGLWPVAWWAPLAEAGILPWFGGREISVIGAVRTLWARDPALATLVAALGMVFPYAKTVALAALQLGLIGPRALPVLAALAKLAMADVFLVALYIVVAKGTGLGYVAPAWGLWLFTVCALAGLFAARAPRGG